MASEQRIVFWRGWQRHVLSFDIRPNGCYVEHRTWGAVESCYVLTPGDGLNMALGLPYEFIRAVGSGDNEAVYRAYYHEGIEGQ